MTDAATEARPTEGDLATLFGASSAVDAYGEQAILPAVTPQALAEGFVAPLTDLGLLAATGEEAAKFLHAQLTNDVEHLGEGEVRWYGYCTPKGRLLATFAGWRDADAISLVLARPQAEPIRKRLTMYLLRTKAKLLDRSSEVVAFGVGGQRAAAGLATLGVAAPSSMTVVRADGLVCAGLPSVAVAGSSCARWLLVAPRDRAASVWRALAGELHAASSTVWRWTEVLAAIPRIVPATAELFVPQMLNFEVVGGVNFKKGCYPGQEIVARSQYLGKLKRRMFVAHLDGEEPAPGADVLPATGGEPCGQVVLAAPSPAGGVDLLFESQTAALEAGAPTIGGVALALGSLPYAMPAA